MRRVSLADWALLASVLASLGWTAKDFGAAQGEAAATIAGSSVSALSDVDTSGAAEGAFLRYRTATWVDDTAAISDLSDVAAITTQTDGQVLTYDTTDGWRNETLPSTALSAVLAVGNTTGANNLSVNTGQSILGAAELTLAASSGAASIDATTTITLDATTTIALEVGATSEVLTITGGADLLTLSAGTGAALALDSVLGTTITATGGDVRLEPTGDQVVVDGELQVWHATEAAGDYVSISHNATNGTVQSGSGTLFLTGPSDVTITADTDDVLLNPFDDASVQVDTGGLFRVYDAGGGELTITPTDEAEEGTIAAVGVSADLILTAPGALTATSTDAALALTADTGGVTITDSSETLTISTTGANAMLIDAGTGSALTISSALDMTLDSGDQDIFIAANDRIWFAAGGAADFPHVTGPTDQDLGVIAYTGRDLQLGAAGVTRVRLDDVLGLVEHANNQWVIGTGATAGVLLAGDSQISWTVGTVAASPDATSVGLQVDGSNVLEVTNGSTGRGFVEAGGLILGGGTSSVTSATAGQIVVADANGAIAHLQGPTDQDLSLASGAAREVEIRAVQLEITDVAGTGDGSIAPVASQIVTTTGLTVPYAALTASRWLGIDESGGVFSNAGAGGTVTVSLRQPTQSGIVYSFVRVAAQELRVDPGDVSGGSTWNIEYSGSSMANGEYLSLASAGAKLTVVSDVTNTAWVVLEEFGTLTEETP